MQKILTASAFGLAPERAARKNAVEHAVMAVFAQYDYREVTLPLYEYYELLKNVSYGFKDESVISFADRASGKTLVLRSDFTPQVCRMVAGYSGQFQLPLRIFYRGEVFRNVAIDKGAKTEAYQIGCELYGSQGIAGDLELILAISRIMRSLNIDKYRIIFGDVGYISRLLALLGDEAAAEEYRNILMEKALYKLADFVKDTAYNSELRALLMALPLAFGGLTEINTLVELSSFDAELAKRAQYLQEFFQSAVRYGVAADKIVYDPSEARGLGYYTGINFEVLNTATGASLGGGGRYDKLMAKFGVDYTACGMALYLSELAEASLKHVDSGKTEQTLLAGDIAEAEELRNSGKCVRQLFDGE
jgi:ATP phosphoribosyltransferase regulatory subunit